MGASHTMDAAMLLHSHVWSAIMCPHRVIFIALFSKASLQQYCCIIYAVCKKLPILRALCAITQGSLLAMSQVSQFYKLKRQLLITRSLFTRIFTTCLKLTNSTTAKGWGTVFPPDIAYCRPFFTCLHAQDDTSLKYCQEWSPTFVRHDSLCGRLTGRSYVYGMMLLKHAGDAMALHYYCVLILRSAL